MFVLVLVLAAGAAAFVATNDIPPPTKEIRKVLPDETFPR